MILYSRVTELPDGEPVTLTEAKSHLEVTGTSKDTFIASLIKVARRQAEAYTSRSIVTQTRTITLDYFPCATIINPYAEIVIPYGPVQTISITYKDSDGQDQTITDFKVLPGELEKIVAIDENGDLTSWPGTQNTPACIRIEYTAGFDDVSGELLPQEVKQAILLQVGSMYENRQDEVIAPANSAVQLNNNSKMLLDCIKVYWNAHY